MLQFNKDGSLVVPELIQKDLNDQQEAKEQKITVKKLRESRQVKSLIKSIIEHKENVTKLRDARDLIHEAVANSLQKFTDEELIEFHARGLSDGEIASVFRCHPTSVWMRRAKTMKVANHKPWFGENLTEEELRQRYEAKMYGIPQFLA